MTVEPTIAELLTRSFELLERQRSAAWSHLTAALGSRLVEIRLEHERFTLTPSGERLVPIPGGHGEISIATDVATILAILDAELELSVAVRDDRLRVRGSLEDVAAVHDAIVAYVHGGVRCPGFPQLLSQLRQRMIASTQPEVHEHEHEHDGKPRT